MAEVVLVDVLHKLVAQLRPVLGALRIILDELPHEPMHAIELLNLLIHVVDQLFKRGLGASIVLVLRRRVRAAPSPHAVPRPRRAPSRLHPGVRVDVRK